MTAKTEYVNLWCWSTWRRSLFFSWVRVHSCAWVVLFLLNTAGNVGVCLQGGQHPSVCCHERWDRAGWGSVPRRRRGRVSVCDFSSVPFSFRFLPPLGQEGLLVVSHALKLTVRMLRVRGGHFFWTYHVLRVNTKHSVNSRQAFYSYLHYIWQNFSLFLL